jgi:hypothetical protein
VSDVITIVADENVVFVELDDDAVAELVDVGVDLFSSDDAFWRPAWSDASSLLPGAESPLLPACVVSLGTDMATTALVKASCLAFSSSLDCFRSRFFADLDGVVFVAAWFVPLSCMSNSAENLFVVLGAFSGVMSLG